MAAHSSSVDLGRRKIPDTPITQPKTVSAASTSPKASSPKRKKFPQTPSNRIGIQEQQRRVFLYHLSKWSLDHDSSVHFHGKISLAPQSARSEECPELGKSVSCVLHDSAVTSARRLIVIRLFPPKRSNRDMGKDVERHLREDSMDLFDTRVIDIRKKEGISGISECSTCPKPVDCKHRNGITHGYYKLVIRCGAGWMSARDYFNKLHFSNLQTRKACLLMSPRNRTLGDAPAERSKALGSQPLPEGTVTIQPLFHPFTRLPPELQELILFTASGLFGTYNLCSDSHLFPQPKPRGAQIPTQSAISLSTMLRISPHIKKTLAPYIYRATDFHFGLTGFTNFLWQSSSRRSDLRRLTFHFGKLAILHCIRWLSPDHVFELLEPPVVTSPRSLQYFWRCQIQDLAREVNLLTLTFDIRGVPVQDLPMVTRLLKDSFGGVERMIFVETDRSGQVTVVEEGDPRLATLGERKTWRELCRDFFQRHRRFQYFTKFSLLNGDMDKLEKLMDMDKEAFDQS